MSVIVKYDPGDETVPDRVVEIVPSGSVSDPEWSGQIILNNPQFPDDGGVFEQAADRARYWAMPERIKYLRRLGEHVVLMIQDEKDAIDAKEQTDKETMEELDKDIDNLEKHQKVGMILTFKAINRIHKKIGLPEYTWPQFKQVYKDECNTPGVVK